METSARTNKNSSLKTCAVCRKSWNDRNEFLADPDIMIIGYQVHFKDLNSGLFLFNHSCNTSLAIKVGRFTDLYNGPIFKESKMGTGECPDYCLRGSDLSPCPSRCECAYVREIIEIIRKWPKQKNKPENQDIIHPG